MICLFPNRVYHAGTFNCCEGWFQINSNILTYTQISQIRLFFIEDQCSLLWSWNKPNSGPTMIALTLALRYLGFISYFYLIQNLIIMSVTPLSLRIVGCWSVNCYTLNDCVSLLIALTPIHKNSCNRNYGLVDSGCECQRAIDYFTSGNLIPAEDLRINFSSSRKHTVEIHEFTFCSCWQAILTDLLSRLLLGCFRCGHYETYSMFYCFPWGKSVNLHAKALEFYGFVETHK